LTLRDSQATDRESVLYEHRTRVVRGDKPRKWISDDYFDLYVWYEPDSTIFGFQLCYDKGRDERALTWTRAGSFKHNRVDDGESNVYSNSSPILMENCPFDLPPVRTEFLKRSKKISPEIRKLVLERLDAYKPAK